MLVWYSRFLLGSNYLDRSLVSVQFVLGKIMKRYLDKNFFFHRCSLVHQNALLFSFHTILSMLNLISYNACI